MLERNAAMTAPHSTSVSVIDWIAAVLLIVGGLNWGLVGLFQFNLVEAIFGQMTTLSRAVYILVGLAAIFGIFRAAACAKRTTG
jgi:uncharacterized membrane protein YuzA (DUF378 family)